MYCSLLDSCNFFYRLMSITRITNFNPITIMKTIPLYLLASVALLTASCKKSNESQPQTAQVNSQIVNAELNLNTPYDLDGDGDGITDCRFEIINLNLYNPDNPLTDSLAARIVMQNSTAFLNNFETGYPDALNENENITGIWNTGPNGVLGTFHNLGRFKNTDNKYLGLRLNKDGRYTIGWVKLKCNANNSSVKVYEYAFKSSVAGKK